LFREIDSCKGKDILVLIWYYLLLGKVPRGTRSLLKLSKG